MVRYQKHKISMEQDDYNDNDDFFLKKKGLKEMIRFVLNDL